MFNICIYLEHFHIFSPKNISWGDSHKASIKKRFRVKYLRAEKTCLATILHNSKFSSETKNQTAFQLLYMLFY